MNKHMRTKVSAFINDHCFALHRLSPTVSVRSYACSDKLDMRTYDADGAFTQQTLVPSPDNSMHYSAQYPQGKDNGSAPLLCRYNWKEICLLGSDISQCVPPNISINGFEVGVDGKRTPASIYIGSLITMTRSFPFVMTKLGLKVLYKKAGFPNVVFAPHERGCWRIEHNGYGYIVHGHDVRVGEVVNVREGTRQLKSPNDCLNYLLDMETTNE